MLINNLLISSTATADVCASLQPNSQLRRKQNGLHSQAGLLTGGFAMPFASGVAYPSGASFVIMASPAFNTGLIPACAGNVAGNGMGGIRLIDAGMDKTFSMQEVNPGTERSDSYRGNTGLLGTFNRKNTGSHSRLNGWPPAQATAAPPPGSKNAGPGGGPTAS
ncbi:MAG TPA: hypothetical protein VH186_12380 [Chloroflexia bacterium]|nr:hypothetical protein [Chloroflexia bacterium]